MWVKESSQGFCIMNVHGKQVKAAFLYIVDWAWGKPKTTRTSISLTSKGLCLLDCEAWERGDRKKPHALFFF